MTSAPLVFISYAHDDSSHYEWVRRFAGGLKENGIEVILDQWDLGLGADLTLFMEKGIADADRVLVVCTPTYASKANAGLGGVGYERLIITAEIAVKADTEKFIPVLRLGAREDSIPRYLATRLFADFTDDSKYDSSLEELVRDIDRAPRAAKPCDGPNLYNSGKESSVLSTSPLLADITLAMRPGSALADTKFAPMLRDCLRRAVVIELVEDYSFTEIRLAIEEAEMLLVEADTHVGSTDERDCALKAVTLVSAIVALSLTRSRNARDIFLDVCKKALVVSEVCTDTSWSRTQEDKLYNVALYLGDHHNGNLLVLLDDYCDPDA